MVADDTNRELIFQKIYDITKQIPRGKVAAYGHIAMMAGTIPRVVGYAMACLTEGTDVPWHRVINSRGEISLPPGQGFEEQKALLLSEGIKFDSRGRVDFVVYGWLGPGLE